MHSYRFLFAPSAAPGNGTGHLRRAMRWAAGLPRDTYKIYMQASHWREEFSRMAAAYGLDNTCFLFDEQKIKASQWDFVLIDRRATTKADFRWWSRSGIHMIGLDEGGPDRQLFSYLLDTFPIPARFGPPNIFDPAYLSLPDTPPTAPSAPPEVRKVLVSFGGEDPAGLTEICSRWLIETGGYAPASVTVVLGPLFGPRRLPQGVNLLQAPSDLAERLHYYDLVCTSFGLTAYEAAYAGCGVILFNPSPYHRELSRLAGFPTVGVRRIQSRRFSHLLNHPGQVVEAARRAAPAEKRSPAQLLRRFKPPEVRDCPGCGRLTANPVLRCSERSFFRCRQCGLLYQLDFFAPNERYTQNYFFEEYRSQYGRSYLDDFARIKQMGTRRLEIIRRLAAGRPGSPGPSAGVVLPRLLDVGCAYGPFLSAAAEAGFLPEGLEPVEAAAEYVRSELNIPAWNLTFEEFGLDRSGSCEPYDIVTMWYVLEHFARIDGVLSKAGSLLKMGGLLAFSTPNSRGISGRKSLKEFLQRSPRDHHTIWSPAIARRVLPQFGFRVKRIVITGHHPERFPLAGRVLTAVSAEPTRLHHKIVWKIVWSAIYKISRIFGLGDTFEVYAEKIRDVPKPAAPVTSESRGE